MSDPLPTDALAEAPDLPRATPVANEPPPPVEAPPADQRDAAGEAWDPATHVSPPRKNIRGLWARRPGNAQRKRLGLAITGVASGIRSEPPPTPGAAGVELAAEPSPEPAAPPVSASRLVWDDPGLTGPDSMPLITEQLRPREAYATTAKGITRAQFGLAQLHIGPAWEPSDREAKEWTEAWQDFLHEYQLPVLGSILTLVVLLVDSIAKRRKDPDTQRVGLVIRDLILGWRKPKPIHEAPQPPAAPAPPKPPDASVSPITGKTTVARVMNPYGFIGK